MIEVVIFCFGVFFGWVAYRLLSFSPRPDGYRANKK